MSIQLQQEAETTNRASSPVSVLPVDQSGRLRILHVVSRLGMGGTEHGVLKLIRGLGAEEFEHRICAVRGVDANFAKQMNVSSLACAAGKPKPGFQFPLFRLARIMKDFQPHIVHTRNFGSIEAIPAARLARIPITIHSEHGYEIEILRGLPLRRRIACRAFYAMADVVFAVTGDLRSYHSTQSWLPADKFRVIYNGVDTERFNPDPERGLRIRSELGIPSERFLIGSVGRLVPIKDHGTLLAAAERLAQQGRDVHALIVGSGPELKKLQTLAAASSALAGRTTFPGASDRVPELLNAMDAFVLPSICEGMSNTILEAMASGLPVMATRAGGNPELIDEGSNGCLFPPRDAGELARHLSQLIDEPVQRRKFAVEARWRAVEQFSLSGMIQRYRSLYFELAAHLLLQKGH
jgi:sugar transferase (PEP-CTERM/EpsH1 system associated)